jgi:hypothetical protein
MKRIKITNKCKKQILKDFTDYLDGLKPGTKIEYKYQDSVSSDDKPTVILSQKAYIKIKTLVAKAEGEVGWNGTVTRNGNTFTVNDIYVYPQEVTGATVTCDELETAKLLMQLPTEVFNSLRFQGHSHVNMGITPSGTDTTMYEKYLQNLGEDDFYIFMIFNKKDDYYIEINDNKTNIIYYKADINLEIEGTDEFWDSVKDNIRKHTPVQTQPQPQPQNTSSTKCDKLSCRGCADFEKCAKDWYEKKMKELN